MAAHAELRTYIQSVWELIQPSNRRSGIMTDDQVRVKIDEAKTTVVGIIRDIEQQQQQVRNVSIFDQDDTPLPIQSTLISSTTDDEDEEDDEEEEVADKAELDVPNASLVDNAEEESEEDSGSEDENQYEPPLVGSLQPDGTRYWPKSVDVEENDPNRGRKVKNTWKNDHPEEFFDDYAEFRLARENNTKENLRHLYRLLFWLDFLSNRYNGNSQQFHLF